MPQYLLFLLSCCGIHVAIATSIICYTLSIWLLLSFISYNNCQWPLQENHEDVVKDCTKGNALCLFLWKRKQWRGGGQSTCIFHITLTGFCFTWTLRFHWHSCRAKARLSQGYAEESSIIWSSGQTRRFFRRFDKHCCWIESTWKDLYN